MSRFFIMKKNKLSVARFLFELFIVFIGVYGAFVLNNYQQANREQKIRENYFISFRSELKQLTYNIRQAEKAISLEIDELGRYQDSLKDQAFFPLTINFKESLLITQAGFNDDVFVQLSPDLASSLTGGYDYVKSLEQMVDRFNLMAQDKLSGLKWGELFNNQGTLKTDYKWYLKQLDLLKESFNTVGSMMENEATPFVEQVIEGF